MGTMFALVSATCFALLALLFWAAVMEKIEATLRVFVSMYLLSGLTSLFAVLAALMWLVGLVQS